MVRKHRAKINSRFDTIDENEQPINSIKTKKVSKDEDAIEYQYQIIGYPLSKKESDSDHVSLLSSTLFPQNDGSDSMNSTEVGRKIVTGPEELSVELIQYDVLVDGEIPYANHFLKKKLN